MPVLPVTDPDDPRLAPYRALREKDLKRDDGLFVAEGVVVLDHLIRGGRFEIHSLLIADNRLGAIRHLVDALPADVPVLVAPLAVMSAVAGFPMHRGVLALGRRPAPRAIVDALAAMPDRALVLVASEIANHDNVGALFRNAAAFGVDLVILDAASCDPLYRKAIRVSVGGALRVPFVHGGTIDDIARALHAARFETIALSPAGREDVATLERPARAALLVGAEGPGLPPELLATTRTAAIPMAAGFDSLNVATAAAIALHRLATR